MSRSSAAAASNVVAFRPRGSAPAKAARKPYVRLTDAARAKLADKLVALSNPGKVDYQRLAKQFGVSVRTVQSVRAEALANDLQRGNSGRARVWPLPEDTLTLIAQYRNCRLAWEALAAEGRYGGTYSAFMRAINDQLGATTRKRVAAGTGHTAGMGRLAQDRPAFGHTYTLDIFALRAPATVNGQLVHPYAALIREAHSGLAVAHHLFATDEINAAMVASLMGTAFRGRRVPLPDDRVEDEVDPIALVSGADSGGVDADEAVVLEALTERTIMFVGGIPDCIVCDNGSIFIAGELDAALAGHGVVVTPINSYASHENGSHERLHRTLRSRLLAQLPGSSDGPRDERGQLIDTRDPLTLAQARTLLAYEVDQYNRRIDSRGNSPLARWLAADPDGRIKTRPAAKSLTHLAHLQDGTVQRYSQGLRLNNEHYQSPTVHEHPSKRFLVGIWYGNELRDQVLRGADSATWGAVAMTFIDDNGKRFTAARIYTVPRGASGSGDVSTRMVTLEARLDLRELEPLRATGFDKRSLESRWTTLTVHPTYAAFSQKLFDRLGIGANGDGVKALRLLARIQAGHQIPSVDGLYKSMVLEQPATYAAAERAVEHFRDLEDTYREMVTAAEKSKHLARLPELWAERAEALATEQLIDTFGVTRTGATPFLRWQLCAEAALLETAVTANRAERREVAGKYDAAKPGSVDRLPVRW